MGPKFKLLRIKNCQYWDSGINTGITTYDFLFCSFYIKKRFLLQKKTQKIETKNFIIYNNADKI